MGPANNPQIDDATRAVMLDEIADNLSTIIGKSKQRHHELATEAAEKLKRKSSSKEREETVASGGETPIKDDESAEKKTQIKTSESEGEGSVSSRERQTKSPSVESKAISVSYRKKDYPQSTSYRLDFILRKTIFFFIIFTYCVHIFCINMILIKTKQIIQINNKDLINKTVLLISKNLK